MPIYLKQSTASQEVPLGYFVDSTDGNTEETGLTIANTDIKVWKTGATTLANKNSGGATHISNGVYYAVLDATDTDTLGPLVLFCHPSGALPVRVECVVLAANIYDSMIGGGDVLDVSVTQISGSAVSTSTAQLGVNVVNAGGTAWGSGAITAASIATDAITAAKIAADAIGASELAADAATEIATATWAAATRTLSANTNLNDPTAAAIADAVWDEARAGHVTAGTYGETLATVETNIDNLDAAVSGRSSHSAADVWGVATRVLTANTNLNDPTAAAIADAVLDEALSGHTTAGTLGKAVADIETDATAILADTNELQTDDVPGLIAALNDPTAAAIADAVWDEAIAGHAGAGSTGEALSNATAPTAAAVADAVWDEAISGHLGAGSTGEALNAAGGAGDPWITSLPGSYTSGQAGNILGNIATTVNAQADAALADYDAPTKAELDAGLAALNDITAADVWAAATRTLSANTNLNDPTAAAIADAVWDEAKSGHVAAGSFGEEVQAHALSTEVSALNDLSSADVTAAVPTAAQIRAEVDSNSTQLAAIVADTNELQTDWANGGRLDLILDARASQASVDTVDSNVDAVLVDTGTTIPAQISALNNLSAAQVNAEVVDVLRTDTIPDSYAADGAQPTIAQAILAIQQFLMEKAVSGTTVTVKKPDGSTTAMTLTLNDADAPTSITRAS